MAAAHLLLRELHKVLLDDVADLLQVRDDEDQRHLALGLLVGELLRAELDEELLDVLLEAIDHVVACDDLPHERLVVALEHNDRVA